MTLELLYSVLGEAKIAAMTAAFYRRVPQDDLLGPMYPPDDLAGAEERLRDFLVMRLGGPARYMENRGHPRLRARHTPFSIGSAERDRWLEIMDEAMAETDVPSEARDVLRPFFAQVAEFMRNRD